MSAKSGTETRVHLFVGGPHHHEVWTTEELMYRNEKLPEVAWITDYAWTADTVVGSESGRVARVWVYREAVQN